MTVDNTPVAVVYTVTKTGTGQSFAITFPYISPSFVKLYSVTNDVETKLTYNTDYTVSKQTVTVSKSLTKGDKLVVFRVTDITQEILWVDGQAVYTPDIMQADDKITHILQELAEQIDRSIKITKEEAAVNPSTDLLGSAFFQARDEAVAAAETAEAARDRAEQLGIDLETNKQAAVAAINDKEVAGVAAVGAAQAAATDAISSQRQSAMQEMQAAVAAAEGSGQVALAAQGAAEASAMIAKQKADSIIGLTVKTNTLDPAQSATSTYNNVTGELTLGIPAGVPGQNGKDGKDGRDGVDGERGEKGERGDPGVPGPQGQAPYADVIDCGGACGAWLTTITAGTACSFN